jgi:TRAP-type C4-dicarboxylate transport system permease small subunit
MQDRSRLIQIIEVSDKIGYLIEMTSGALSVLFFATMTIITLLGVLFRYVMINPFEWTEEMARFLVLCMWLLSFNIALRKREHIAITAVVQGLPPKLSKLLGYCVDILIGFFLIVLIKQGYLMTTRTLMTASTIDISMFWIYLFVPVGALLTLFQLALGIAKKILSEFGPVSAKI